MPQIYGDNFRAILLGQSWDAKEFLAQNLLKDVSHKPEENKTRGGAIHSGRSIYEKEKEPLLIFHVRRGKKTNNA